MLGLVSSKTAELEDQASLLRRIEEAARVLPLDQLGLSTQCGFASVAGGNVLTEDEQWAKLELIVETAAARLGQPRRHSSRVGPGIWHTSPCDAAHKAKKTTALGAAAAAALRSPPTTG